MKLFGRVAVSAMLGVALGIPVASKSNAQGAAPYEKWRMLSEREKTFLKTVFAGDESKAVEYAQVAGINVNAIAGEPLSTWFYRMGAVDMGRPSVYRVPAVQRIVFERFKQNPNPPGIGESQLGNFCNHAPAPQDFGVESRGTPDQIKALREAQANARRPHIEAMASGFSSLLRYGLKDRQVMNQIFSGCIFRNAAPLDGYYYDTVLSPMLKAGADINARSVSGMRPIEQAVKEVNGDVVERLVRDGAQITMPLKAGLCAEPSNLYGYLFAHVKPRNPEPVLRVVRALSAGGLPPTTKVSYITQGGYGSCKFSSFADAVIDAGDLDFARRVKEASARPVVATAPSSPPTAAAPRIEQANVAAPAAFPPQIGAWIIRTKNDGRLHATAKVSNSHPDRMAGLILECMPGGRLEYVPAVLKLNGFAKSLYVHGKDDNMNELKLANGRLAGAGAATLSRDLLQAEINAGRQGLGDKWDIGMTVDDAYVEESMVHMSGFAQMRNLMLANCKN